MKRFVIWVISVAVLSAVCITSCVHQPEVAAQDGNFPPQIANIMVNKCAISGCHNAASYQNADNLLLDTWDHLFNGSITGASVVPYNPAYSSLLYYVNTDSSLGLVAQPTMPYTTTGRVMHPLSKDEYMALETWISNGAPDKNGNIAFASNPDTRQKIYLTQQGCDLMAVIDAERNVVMRYIPIGMSAQIESPHCVKVSADGKYAYVSFVNGNYVQKIDTRTDQVVSSANVGTGSWNILYLSPGDTSLVTSDWEGEGYMAFVHSADMQVKTPYIGGGGTMVYPHGITSNATYDTFFITAQYGNVIYKIAASGLYYKKISLDGNPPSAASASAGNTPDPHELLMAADYSRYFVTCENSNEVRVMDARTDSVIAHISVGTFPQDIAISKVKPYLFITCMYDNSTLAGREGSVYIINYNTYEVVSILYGDFYEPHGITVDDKSGKIYIASTNANGIAPHHATACAGKPGWYTVYDLNTLQPLNDYRYEVTVMPYSFATRFTKQ